MGVDPKIKNLTIFFLLRGGVLFGLGYFLPSLLGIYDPYKLAVLVIGTITAWRILLSIYRRMILPPKQPKDYGEWVIVTGSTSGIGKAFIEHMAGLGLNVVAISRSEDKLKEQVENIRKEYGVKAEYLAFDFTQSGQASDVFYGKVDKMCAKLAEDGHVGVLINNVGTANTYPMALEEFTDKEIQDMIQCNIYSTMNMTRVVMKHMKERKKGCIVNVSSGSGNHPTPMLAIYSSTKAFITQFSRSMHVECWDTGVDHLAVTPYYVVSNLYKRKSGTLLAPMPIALVKGTLAQLGKRYIWQGHGYWFHGFLGVIGAYYWGTTERWKKVMSDNRARYDAKQALATRQEEEVTETENSSSKKSR